MAQKTGLLKGKRNANLNGRGGVSQNGTAQSKKSVLPLFRENGAKNGNRWSRLMKNAEKQCERARIDKWIRENLPPPGTPEWEALCTGCGKCCNDKVWSRNRLVLLTSVCSFLDKETKRCACYAERFGHEPLCMPIDAEIVMMGGLPEDCPYVENLPDYRGPREVDKTLDEW